MSQFESRSEQKCQQELAASLPGESPTRDTDTSLLSELQPPKLCSPREEKNSLKSTPMHFNSNVI